MAKSRLGEGSLQRVASSLLDLGQERIEMAAERFEALGRFGYEQFYGVFDPRQLDTEIKFVWIEASPSHNSCKIVRKFVDSIFVMIAGVRYGGYVCDEGNLLTVRKPKNNIRLASTREGMMIGALANSAEAIAHSDFPCGSKAGTGGIQPPHEVANFHAGKVAAQAV